MKVPAVGILFINNMSIIGSNWKENDYIDDPFEGMKHFTDDYSLTKSENIYSEKIIKKSVKLTDKEIIKIINRKSKKQRDFIKNNIK